MKTQEITAESRSVFSDREFYGRITKFSLHKVPSLPFRICHTVDVTRVRQLESAGL